MTRGGSIIQISSATATIMLDNHAAYMGTKAGIDHVVRCVANEFGARGGPRQLDFARPHGDADDRGGGAQSVRDGERSPPPIPWAASDGR